MQNYYQVLGVDRDADIEVIRKAYRKAATKSHPDMGGTHAKMTLINEAYAVLSDQTLRAEYDRVFFGSRDEQARADWEESAEEVREAASEYPQHWEEFEDWMRGFTKDVAAAKYGSKKVFGPIVIPTVDGSVSAIIAMVIGGFSGFILLGICTGLYGYLLRRILDPQPDEMRLHGFLWIALVAGPVVIGLWAGQFFHKTIQKMAEKSNTGRKRDVKKAKVVIPCPECGRKLKVPSLEKTLVVTCKNCRHRFEHAS